MKKQVLQTTKRATKDILKYNSARQKRCWAVVVEALQQFIPGNEEIDWKTLDVESLRQIFPLNNLSEFEVEIIPKYVVSHHKDSIKTLLKKMTQVDVIEEEDEQGRMATFPLFYTLLNKNGRYWVGIPPRSLRWLLNFTKKTGYVSFCVQSFMVLSRPTSMNLYLYISENLKREHPKFGKGVWDVGIDELRERLDCPKQIDTNRFITDYVKECKEEIDAKGCRLTFEFEYILKQVTTGKRARIVGLRFRITDHGCMRPPVDDGCYEEEEEETPVQSEKDRWDEWDRIVEERRKQYEKHSA